MGTVCNTTHVTSSAKLAMEDFQYLGGWEKEMR